MLDPAEIASLDAETAPPPVDPDRFIDRMTDQPLRDALGLT